MNDEERFALGESTRQRMLGDEAAERARSSRSPFNGEFRDLMTRFAWGEVWARPGLDPRARSVATIAALTALGQEDELAVHLRGALNNGLTVDEIKEVLIQMSVYCGAAAANKAFVVAERVLAGPPASQPQRDTRQRER
jgi:alkylhydroperoxidase/carboxymuconolactone decarboxylase family protein YurZ